MKNIPSLKNFGFSEHDQKVYTVLMNMGQVKSGEIIKQTGIASSQVYASLQKLIHGGLVSFSVKNNIRYYNPQPPEQLLEVSQKQSELLTEFINNFKIENTEKTSDRITVYQGIHGYKQAFINHIKNSPKTRLQIIGYGTPYRSQQELRMFFKKIDELMKQVDSTAEMVIDASLVPIIHKDRRNDKLYTIKTLPSQYFSAMAINISPKEVMITIIGTIPFAICIRDKQVIEAFKKYFSLLFSIGKVITK